MQYITNAVNQIRMAKQYDMAGALEMTIFHARKGSKIMDQLYNLRKDQYPEYQVLLAPFYYKIGDAIVSYIECNMNEMNALKPLVLPDDPDEVEEEQSQATDPLEEEKVPDEEPVIEDVIDSKAEVKENITSPKADMLGNDNTEFEELS